MNLLPHKQSRILILACHDSILTSIIANTLEQNNFQVFHPDSDEKSIENLAEQVRTGIEKGYATVLVIDSHGEGASECIAKLKPFAHHDVEVVSDYEEAAKEQIKKLEASLLANTLEIKRVKRLLSRIHEILIGSDKQLDQHKARLRGIDRAYVEELLNGISELIEQAMLSRDGTY